MKRVLVITEEGKTLKTGLTTPTPIKTIFAGSFLEVYKFVEELKSQFPFRVDFYILSAGFGLANGDRLVKPSLSFEINGEIKEVVDKLQIHDKLIEILGKYDIIIILFPAEYLNVILSPKKMINFLYAIKENAILIVVCAKNFGQELLNEARQVGKNAITFNRAGVARIGKNNREGILEIIKRAHRHRRIMINRGLVNFETFNELSSPR